MLFNSVSRVVVRLTNLKYLFCLGNDEENKRKKTKRKRVKDFSDSSEEEGKVSFHGQS